MPPRPVIDMVTTGVDGTESSLAGVRWAAREAARRKVPLRLVCAVDPTALRPIHPPALGEGYRRDVIVDQAVTHLERAAAEAARTAPTVPVTWEVLEGGAEALRAESDRARLLVVGNRGRGDVAGLVAGSTSIDLAASARGPVVVVRGVAPDDAPIVVGVDGSRGGNAALAFAFEEAGVRAVPLIAVHGVGNKSADPEVAPQTDAVAIRAAADLTLRNCLEPWTAKFPDVDVRRRIGLSGPGWVLVAESAGAALVVTGSRGRGGLAGLLLGSVSQEVLHHAHCPIAVAHAEGDTSRS